MRTAEQIRATFPVQFLSQTPMGQHAMDCASELILRGWTARGAKYDIGIYCGDQESYEEKTGEPLKRLDAIVLERMIRDCLDAAYDPDLDN